MFLLSKLLAFFISPFNIIFLLLVLAYFIKARRNFFLLTGIILFLFFSQPLIFRGVVKKWEGVPTQLPLNDSTIQRVVVLGGMASHHEEYGRIRFWQSGDRLMQALLLVHQNPVKDLIISGGSAAILIHERPEGAFLKEFLEQIGMDSGFITVDSLSRNTFENAVNSAKIFEDRGWKKKIALVTSSWHMPRAKWCFEQVGFEVHAIGTDFMYPLQPIVFTDYFLPSVPTISQWQLLIKEWVGWIAYRIRY